MQNNTIRQDGSAKTRKASGAAPHAPDELPEFLQSGSRKYDYPALVVRESTAYLSIKALETTEFEAGKPVAVAPNPQTGGRDFLICHSENGWRLHGTGSGAQFSAAGSVHSISEEHDRDYVYELEDSGIVHPNWDSKVYRAVPEEPYQS